MVANQGEWLVLVLMQMNQNEELLRVQVTNDFYASYIAADTTFAGENLPAIWQKAIEEPENLSIGEMRAMEAQTFSPLSRWINLYRLAEAGIVDDSFWKTQLEMDVSYYFSSQYGRAWWEVFGNTITADYLPQELKDYVEKELATTSVDNPLIQYRKVQQIIERDKSSAHADP
jgi:hypothetical protein